MDTLRCPVARGGVAELDAVDSRRRSPMLSSLRHEMARRWTHTIIFDAF